MIKYLLLLIPCLLWATDADTLITLADSTWHQLPHSNLNSVAPTGPEAIFQGVGGANYVIDAWSGGDYDATNKRFFVISDGSVVIETDEPPPF